jgi:hypothetical protein
VSSEASLSPFSIPFIEYFDEVIMTESNTQTEGVVIDFSNQKSPLSPTAEQLKLMLKCIEQDVLPKTEQEVANGNKVFGALQIPTQKLHALFSTVR